MKHLYIDLSCPVAELNTEKVKALAGRLKATREDLDASVLHLHPIPFTALLLIVAQCCSWTGRVSDEYCQLVNTDP
jgi:hypothetical protein